MRSTVVAREVAWAGCMLVGLLLFASATFAGSWLLRFGWFSGLFRMPTESVLIPLWFAVFTAPVVAASATLFWLGRIFAPQVETSKALLLFAHLLSLAVVLGAGLLFLQPRSLPAFVVLAAAALLLGPRLLIRRLMPRPGGGAGAA